MKKKLAQFLVVAIACAGLAVFWHGLSMSTPMNAGDDGMSAACLTVCLGIAPQDAPAVNAVVELFVWLLVIVILSAVSFFRPARQFFFEIFHKDRHRYLMKTMVMLR